jgi:hypothetical protein
MIALPDISPMALAITAHNAGMEVDDCKHCGELIVKSRDELAAWFHMTPGASRLDRGCRAASFTRDGTWDDALDRKWMARPA